MLQEKLWHFSDVDVQHLAEITAAVASGRASFKTATHFTQTAEVMMSRHP